jgi:hypothetical protein
MTYLEGTYKLTNFKNLHGMEGQGFSAILNFKGKKLGEVRDDGNGGPIFYQISKEDYQDLSAYAKALPSVYHPQVGNIEMDADLFLHSMVEEMENAKLREKNRKHFEASCKKWVLFRLGDEKPGAWRIFKNPRHLFDAAVAKRGDKPVILNDLMLTDPYAWEKY